MQRPDAMLIKRFLGKHARGDGDDQRQIVNRAMEVPLLDFSHKDDARDFEWSMSSQDFIKDVDHWTLADGDEVAVEVAEWAFDEFVFVYRRPVLMQDVMRPSDGWLSRADEDLMQMQATVWAYINTDVQDPFLTQMNGYWPNVMEGLDELRVKRGLKDPVTAAYYTTQYVVYDGEPWAYRWDGFFAQSGTNGLFIATDGTEAFWDEATHGLTTHAQWTYGGMVRLMTYLKYGDKHLVEVIPAQPHTKKRNNELTKKRPWLNATGPHMLLLDRMPATQTEHQGGTHASPKPHRRRGHWKTLKHPKYRHHPQYQKQIYVKPSFVGPRQVTYEGNIYRVVEPIEETLSNSTT
tara:strand:+ start:78 stop:1124 length:1047 start_codon:yes stop_codon:yes gene_type:complete